jgi:hypothetical protein
LLGYRLVNGRYEIFREEAEIVRLIYDEYLSGAGCEAIAQRLNEEGVVSRFGAKWCKSEIVVVLSNYAYTGNLLLQKTYVENHITKRKLMNNGELPKYHVQDSHEAIIDIDVFTAVQEERERRAERFCKKNTPMAKYPFTGLLICGGCGKKYRRKTTASGDVWICSTYNSLGKAACSAKQIPENTLCQITAEVINNSNITAEALRSRIESVSVCAENTLIYRLTDGTEVTRVRKDRSRSLSRTDEMKEAARQKSLETKRRGN